MKRIFKVNTDNVVIGSDSIDEYKFQAIAFMERIYNCIMEDKDYSPLGYSNIAPWTHNLLNYLKHLEDTKKYHYNEFEHYTCLAQTIRYNLEALKCDDSYEYKRLIKDMCIRHWEQLLKSMTSRYNIIYERL